MTDRYHIDTARPYVTAFAPGRTEIAGNHTDHQGGMTLSAAVEQGIRVLLQKRDDSLACIRSTGYDDICMDIRELDSVASERHSACALVRGVCAGLAQLGVLVGGFTAVVTSEIEPGGGLSSSAALELAFAKGLDVLYGDGTASPAALAGLSCEAERNWFGKPCGLQDQTAIAYGGISLIDYSAIGQARVERVDADLDASGITLALVHTGCDHSAHTDAFTQLVDDMHDVARLLGAQRLGELDESALLSNSQLVRSTLSDRAFLRALHYYNEMRLVEKRVDALKSDDIERFLRLTNASGTSSAELLQNVSVPGEAEQPALVTLGVVQHTLNGLDTTRHGACRIHGGGFGGSVQAYVPTDRYADFVERVERVCGSGCCQAVRISPEGARARWM